MKQLYIKQNLFLLQMRILNTYITQINKLNTKHTSNAAKETAGPTYSKSSCLLSSGFRFPVDPCSCEEPSPSGCKVLLKLSTSPGFAASTCAAICCPLPKRNNKTYRQHNININSRLKQHVDVGVRVFSLRLHDPCDAENNRNRERLNITTQFTYTLRKAGSFIICEAMLTTFGLLISRAKSSGPGARRCC